MPKFALILPAAGRSTRFADQNSGRPVTGSANKVFKDLKGRPVWLRAVEPFTKRDDVVQTIVAVSPEELETFKDRYRANLAFMDLQVIAGGAERCDTVMKALAEVREDVDFVAIHDAARPLIAAKWIEAVFAAATNHDAVIPAIPISSTIKRVDARKLIVETVPREGLFAAQTPQVFKTAVLKKACAERGDAQPTDEAALVEKIGASVGVVTGWPMNFKITTQDDFRMAELLIDHLPQESGMGSLHPFADDKPGLF